jgi:hypothetical protein
MNLQEKERLRFRRQYIMTNKRINCPFSHQVFSLDEHYFLYTHIDLLVSEINENGVRLILLGDILDCKSPEKGNSDILKDILTSDYNKFLDRTSGYAGRFVLIHIYKGIINLMHDATACRKIYYFSGNGFACASQPHLLARVVGEVKTTNPEKLKFYKSSIFKSLNNSNIGDLTVYDSIFQLLPNHYLNLNEQKAYRYWSKNIQCGFTFDETVTVCANMIQGYMESISRRYAIMLPVTAGKDSRTLLAATKNISNEVYYYINKENRLDSDSLDITIPKKLITELGLPFHVLNPYKEIDKDFEEVYYENNPDATSFYLPHIYNYYLNFQDKVNLPGNFVASAYDMYGSYVKSITPELLAVFNGVGKYKFAIDYYKRWLEGNREFCKQHHINTLMLFYWEERLANWGTQVQLDKDIAQEDLIPFNSRDLIHYFFSVKPEFIDRPGFLFFKKIIGELWCELLLVPTNPSFKNKVAIVFYKAGILEIIRKVLFWYQIKLRSISFRPK